MTLTDDERDKQYALTGLAKVLKAAAEQCWEDWEDRARTERSALVATIMCIEDGEPYCSLSLRWFIEHMLGIILQTTPADPPLAEEIADSSQTLRLVVDNPPPLSD